MKKILLLLLPLIILVCTSILRYESFDLDLKITPYIYILVLTALYYFKFDKSRTVFIYSLCGLLLSLLIIIAIDGKPSLYFFVNFLFYIIGVVLSYISFMQKRKWAKAVCIIFLPLLQVLYINYLSVYADNYIEEGSFTGEQNSDLNKNFKAVNAKNDTIAFNSDNYYLLDFWFTQCGACFRGFPHLQKVYDKYKQYPNISIYAVNRPVEGDTLQEAFNLISERNYTFPVVIGIGNIDSLFNINSFPTICILHRNSLIFRGSLELAEKELEKIVSSQ